jgi:hypothetical protein
MAFSIRVLMRLVVPCVAASCCLTAKYGFGTRHVLNGVVNGVR